MTKKEWAALVAKQARQRAKLQAEILADVKITLNNDEGFARLLAISEEEWQAAMDASEEQAEAAKGVG